MHILAYISRGWAYLGRAIYAVYYYEREHGYEGGRKGRDTGEKQEGRQDRKSVCARATDPREIENVLL